MLPGQDKSKENRIENTPEQTTIMPTMIDDSEVYLEKKRDLSAIIPKDSIQGNAENGELINSKDYGLKSDGSISLATINVDGEITMSPNAGIPEQIDIEERRKIALKNKGVFKKEKKKKTNKTAQKIQNYTALGALLVIIGLGCFYYWYKHHPTDKDFKPLPITIELGDALPKRTSDYVKPGVGDDIDEMEYALDLSQVKEEEVGEYTFTVTYKNITKKGTIIVEDTTPPVLSTREVVIREGKNYTPAQFVESCSDYSGCNYSFQIETEGKHDFPGNYVVHVTATDAFQNTTTKIASLTIEAAGTTVRYSKHAKFSFELGYKTDEYYELVFVEGDENPVILRGKHELTYIFNEKTKYDKAAETYSGELGYTLDPAGMKIKFVENVSQVGSNYSYYREVNDYLTKAGFSH